MSPNIELMVPEANCPIGRLQLTPNLPAVESEYNSGILHNCRVYSRLSDKPDWDEILNSRKGTQPLLEDLERNECVSIDVALPLSTTPTTNCMFKVILDYRNADICETSSNELDINIGCTIG